MRTINKAKTFEESVDVDLTPMLDVVFIMLIFFIVTASFVREASVSVERPPPHSAANSDEQKNIVVTLRSDNQILLDGLRVDHRSLRAHFERHRAASPEASLVVSAAAGSKTSAVVQITDAARQAGIYQVMLADLKAVD